MLTKTSVVNEVLGQRDVVSLRRLTPDAVDAGYLEWINNPHINDFLESRFKVWSRDDLVSYINKINESQNDWLFGIFYEDVYIGNIKIGPLEPHHGRASVGLMIGNPEYHGKGCGLRALKIIQDFSFQTLGIRKLTAGCYAENKASLNVFLKAGFSIEGTLKDHVLWHGQECDVILLGYLGADKND